MSLESAGIDFPEAHFDLFTLGEIFVEVEAVLFGDVHIDTPVVVGSVRVSVRLAVIIHLLSEIVGCSRVGIVFLRHIILEIGDFGLQIRDLPGVPTFGRLLALLSN